MYYSKFTCILVYRYFNPISRGNDSDFRTSIKVAYKTLPYVYGLVWFSVCSISATSVESFTSTILSLSRR